MTTMRLPEGRKPPSSRSERQARRSRSALITALLVVVSLLGLVTGTPAEASHRDRTGSAQQPDAPNPVLLVAGTFATQRMIDSITFLDDDFEVHKMPLSPWLGFNGAASMATSAQAVADRVGDILDASDAERVDIIGHSQAAPVIRYYVKNLGGLDEVAGVVSLGGVNFGVPRQGGSPLIDLLLGIGCFLGAPVCGEIFYDQEPGDTAFLTELNDPDPTPGDIDYFHLFTESEEEPGTAETIPLPGATNLSVQEACPGRFVAHVDEWDDAAMQELIRAALARAPLASTCP